MNLFGSVKNSFREHRLVVLPQMQGVGIGSSISEAIGEYYLLKGHRYFTKTSHGKLGSYRNKNPEKWRKTGKNETVSGLILSWFLISQDNGRICYCHEFFIAKVAKEDKEKKTLSYETLLLERLKQEDFGSFTLKNLTEYKKMNFNKKF